MRPLLSTTALLSIISDEHSTCFREICKFRPYVDSKHCSDPSPSGPRVATPALNQVEPLSLLRCMLYCNMGLTVIAQTTRHAGSTGVSSELKTGLMGRLAVPHSRLSDRRTMQLTHAGGPPSRVPSSAPRGEGIESSPSLGTVLGPLLGRWPPPAGAAGRRRSSKGSRESRASRGSPAPAHLRAS